MSDKAWKAFERAVAALFGGQRFWSNSGELLDFEGPTTVGQCKLVKQLSLSALSDLAEIAERQGVQKFKAGVVAIKCRRGRGRASPLLIVMTETTWRAMHGSAPIDPPLRTPGRTSP